MRAIKNLPLALAVLCFLAFSSAESKAQDQIPRENGWYLGFGLGGGKIDGQLEGLNISKGSGSFELEAAYAINRRVLLGANVSSHIAFFQNGERLERNGLSGAATQDFTLNYSSTAGTARFFLTQDLYLGAKLGFVVAKINNDSIAGQSNIGFMTSPSLGYEWRLAERFTLTPEVQYNYFRINGENTNAFGAMIRLGWYLGN